MRHARAWGQLTDTIRNLALGKVGDPALGGRTMATSEHAVLGEWCGCHLVGALPTGHRRSGQSRSLAHPVYERLMPIPSRS